MTFFSHEAVLSTSRSWDFRAEGPAVYLAQPNGLGIGPNRSMLGPTARPFVRAASSSQANGRAVGPKRRMLQPAPGLRPGLGKLLGLRPGRESLRPRLGAAVALRLMVVAALLIFANSSPLHAHEIRPALLDISEREPGFFDVQWKVPALGDRSLPIKPIFPECMKPVGPPSAHAAPGAILQYFSFKTDGAPIAGETIFIDGLTGVQIDVLVRINLANGDSHSIILRPKSPSLVIPERASKGAVAWSYLKMGVEHILGGIDHLLFVLALVIIVPNLWMLFKTITAFTVAHSITLALASLGFVNVPSGPTEAVIALSIVFLAVEIVHSRRGKFSLTEQYPWIVAMTFGLFHGLGFAGALSEVGLPQHEIPLALFMFNVGVELGQIAFVLVILVLLGVWRFAIAKLPSIEALSHWQLVPYCIGSVAAYWMIERTVGFL
jgi:hydrogenase/urease accessory protein HupE